MATAATIGIRPDQSKVYGLTHSLDGASIVRVPRTLKVSIGVPKGRDIHVFIDAGGQWCVELGAEKDGKRVPKVARFDSKNDALAAYRNAVKTAPESKYPRKIPYFTFLRPGPDGSMVHDFGAIESHGPMPTEIDVLFLNDQPLDAKYEWWVSSGLQCSGDGATGMRLLTLAKPGSVEEQLAERARKAGERCFPIIDGCWMRGCEYAKQGCKPKGRLSFQLPKAPRLGGTAFFDTTGFRSIQQIHSCLEVFREVTGRGDVAAGFVAGVPIKMILRPYRVKAPNGKMSTQYGVSLEVRAGDAISLRRGLIDEGERYRASVLGKVQQITAAVPIEAAFEAVHEGQQVADEFYAGDDGDVDADFERTEAPEVKMPQRKAAAVSFDQLLSAKQARAKAAGEPELTQDEIAAMRTEYNAGRA